MFVAMTGKLPLVSVIIPNYNYAEYLDVRIQSILNQTYPNFEVIILDDKSTDESLKVISKYEDNPHIRGIYVNECNSGNVFQQWKMGIQLAKGDVVWIAESDDYCEPSMLRILIDEWVKVPNAAAAHVGYVIVDEDSNVISKSKEGRTRIIDGKHFARTRMARFCSFRNASGAIFRKDFAIQLSDEYTSLKSVGDYLFWAQLCSFGKVIEIHKNLTYFRVHSHSVTSNNYSKGITALEDRIVFDWIHHQIGLSIWQSFLAKAAHNSLYRKAQYDSEIIRKSIFCRWGLNARRPLFFEHFCLWLSGSIERHLGLFL